MSDVTTTDLYEVTTALSYLREDMRAPATFSLFVRDLPPGRGFLVAAGLEAALDFLARYRVERDDVEDFAAALHRPVHDLMPLVGLAFEGGEVRAVPEGHVVFAGEPLLEVTAPPAAGPARRDIPAEPALPSDGGGVQGGALCALAAAGRPVVDYSLRRTHGPWAGMRAARLGALVGFAGTSNVAAAVALGLPASGTMAHSYIEAFPSEEAAFRAFALSLPGPVTFLVDTYDTEEGVHIAARVLTDLRRGPGCAIRLDSGDLDALARRARALLDSAGLPGVRIVASGGLDEYGVDRLVRAGAPIDVYAVGTRVGVAADAPYLDAAYKLVEYAGRPRHETVLGEDHGPRPQADLPPHGTSRCHRPGAGGPAGLRAATAAHRHAQRAPDRAAGPLAGRPRAIPRGCCGAARTGAEDRGSRSCLADPVPGS
ncbi:nicotinate phosphoribosyltransferase [Streptomyces lasalocidi]